MPPLLGQKELFDRLTEDRRVTVDSDTITLTLPARTAAILTAEPPAVAADQGKRQARSDLRPR